jgi:uncharacterized protein DUF2721
MTADEIARTIQLILAPVVMVSACAIYLGALMGHYQAVNDRLRSMAHERLDLLREPLDTDPERRERLQELDHESPELLGRHRLLRDAVLAVYSAISLFVFCMLSIAAAVVTGSTGVAQLVLVLFVVATAAMLVGVVLSAIEIRVSHRALAYEVHRVLRLKRDE